MSWIGIYAYQGLQIIRSRFGDRFYEFLLRFGKPKNPSKFQMSKLSEVGSLVGLNAMEVNDATARTANSSRFPFWLKILLVVVAIVGGYIIVRSALYLPGTLYGSIKPDDFHESTKSVALV